MEIRNIEKFKEVTARFHNKIIERKIMKLSEEVGEINQEILKFTNSPNASKSAVGTRLSVIEECIDAMIVLEDLLSHLETTEEEREKIQARKVRKWWLQTKLEGREE